MTGRHRLILPVPGRVATTAPSTVRRVSLERHKEDWERLAEADAMWAVLTSPEEKGGAWNAGPLLRDR